MTRYILGRLVSLLFVIWVVSMITFSLMHAVPGGPFDEDKQPLPPAAKANIMRKYGLDKPVWQQYLNYMGNAVRLDFGIPYQQPTTTVTALIASTWKVTAQVGLVTVLFAFTGGILLGIIAARHQNSWIDSTVTFVAMLGITLPSFVIGTFAILFFAVYLNWLPMGGWSDSACLIGRAFCTDWIMPVAAYSLGPMAVIARYTRASIVDVIRADYVRTARAKGLGERRVIYLHALKNASLPLVTLMGLDIPFILSGAVVTETIFSWPGMGRLFITSLERLDYAVLIIFILMIAVAVVIFQLLTDMLYAALDPRVRYS